MTQTPISITSRVVGCGSIGSRYVQALSRLTNCRPIAHPVSGTIRNAEIQDLCELEFPLGASGSIVELSVVASETLWHAQHAALVAPLSKRLLIEKPLASDLVEWKREAHLNVASGKTWVAAPLRFHEGFKYTQSRLPTIGRIRSAVIDCRSWLGSWRGKRSPASQYSSDPAQGGVLRDLIHEFDYGLAFFGSPLAISCVLQSSDLDGIASDAHANITWIYETFLLTFNLDYLSRPSVRRLHVSGHEGSLLWDVLGGSVSEWGSKQVTTATRTFRPDTNRDLILQRELLHVIRNSRSDGGHESLEAGIRSLHAADLARLSAESGGAAIEWVDPDLA